MRGMKRLLSTFIIGAAALGISFSALAQVPSRITNVRFGSHPTFDRMVIDIRGPMPSSIRITKPYSLRTDGEGRPVNLRGRANIQVSLFPADGHTRYVGPNRIRDLRMQYLHGFQKIGDFEAVVTFGITTDIANPKIKVMRLRNPTRLVLDISRI
jgi:hypothetical protein